MSFRNILMMTIAMAAFVAPSQAASVTWNFSGVFQSTNYGPHGTTIAGSLTFDPNASVVSTGQNSGYTFPVSMAFTVSGYSSAPFDVTYTGSGGSATFYDNYSNSLDLLQMDTGATSSDPNQIWQTMQFSILDYSQTLLNSVAMPTSVPDLAGRSAKIILNYQHSTTYFNDTYTITSLTDAAVPEPGAFGLLGIGVAGVALFRRRKSAA